MKFFPSTKSSTEIEAAAPATATTSATPAAEVQTCTVYVGRISAEACGIRGRIGMGGFFLCHDLDVSDKNTDRNVKKKTFNLFVVEMYRC